MSVFKHTEVEGETLATEEVLSRDALDNLFDHDPEKRVMGKMQVRTTGTIDGAKWSLSRALSDAMDSGLWRFVENQGSPTLGKLEKYMDRRELAFREVKPVVMYCHEITEAAVRNVRRKFNGVIHQGCSLLLDLEWIDQNDPGQGAMVTHNGLRLFSVRVPFRLEGNKVKSKEGWTFWLAHPYTHSGVETVEFHDVIIEIPETKRKLRLIGLPAEIDNLFSKKRGLTLITQVRVLRDNEWKWIPHRLLKDNDITYRPTPEGPRLVKRVSRFIKMAMPLPSLISDGHLRWVAKAQELLKELAGGLKEIEHCEGIKTEVLVPGSYRVPEEVLSTGAVERISDSGIDVHEQAHYKLNEWFPCGTGWTSRLDPFPEFHGHGPYNTRPSTGEWVYKRYSNADGHTRQDFYPRDGEEVYKQRDEWDRSSEICIQDIVVGDDMMDENPIDIATIAFSMPGTCQGCGMFFDHGLERKCPRCGHHAGHGILWTTQEGVKRPIKWFNLRANPSVKHGDQWLGGTSLSEFMSMTRRLIRDKDCLINVVTPWILRRDLDEWSTWVEEHGDDKNYPGAMLKQRRLKSFEGETSIKRMHYARMYSDPYRFRRMMYSTPDGVNVRGSPNRIFCVRGELKNGLVNKYALRPDRKGMESIIGKAFFFLDEEKADEMGMKYLQLPSKVMVVTFMNDEVRDQKLLPAIHIGDNAHGSAKGESSGIVTTHKVGVNKPFDYSKVKRLKPMDYSENLGADYMKGGVR